MSCVRNTVFLLALSCLMISCAPRTNTTKTSQENNTQPTTPVAEFEPSPKPEPTVESAVRPQAAAQPESETVAESKPEPVQQAVTEPKPEPETLTTPEPKPEAMVQEQPMTKTTRKISGRVNLDTSKIRDKAVDITETVVYFQPEDKNYSVTPRTDFVISTQNKRFEPNVMAIPVGSEILFPNRDKILHNVFSVSGTAQFDLGLYSPGEERRVKFDKPGVVFVHCNVHHSMQADVLVLDTPWYVNVNSDGSFSLQDLPDQTGTLNIWHPRAQSISREITSTSHSPNINITVPITRQKVPKHLNKFGKSYRPSRK